ncbi:hypothetical protein HY041_04140, partial [Candidatus Roizmanbacteria bacterium]|nr:hypothetical protein [Candidatus Roizmanbacteria bacterium]
MYLEGPALAIHHQRAIKIAIEYKGIWRSFHPNLRPPFLFHPDIAINDRRIHYLNQKWGLKNTDKNSLSSDSLDDMVIYDSENKTLILSTDTIGMSDSALTMVINMGVAQSLLSSNRPRSISQEEAQILHTIERQLAEMGYNQQDLSILMLGFRKKVVDEEGKIIAEIGNAAINHSFNKLF